MNRKMMITTVLGIALSTAAACPVKTGYVANGQFKDTTSLTPLCSATFKKVAAEVKPGEYGELYKTTYDLAGARKIFKLTGLFTANGWEQTGTVNNGKVRTLAFKKGGKETDVAIKTVPVDQGDDYVLVVLIGDK